MVIKNITFCILLSRAIHFGFLAKIVNVEMAFVYGDLGEEIYVECPHVMSDVGKADCIIYTNASMMLFGQQDNTTIRQLKS